MKKFLYSVAIFTLGAIFSLTVVYAQKSATKFPDVDYSKYYGKGIDFASSHNIISGYSNKNFGPDDFVTRGQLATMLKRYDDQLLNILYEGNVGKLQRLVCQGIKKENLVLQEDKDVYNDACFIDH